MGTLTTSQSSSKKLLLLASLAALVGPSYAWGNCYYDVYGREVCDGMSYGARVGIAVAILALLLALVLGTFYVRRRRMRRYTQQALSGANRPGVAPSGYYNGSGAYPQGGNNAAYGYAPSQPYNGPPAGPGQYYEQQSQTYNYGPGGENWVPPPPKYEAPPPGAQPTKGDSQAAGAAYYAPPSGPPPASSGQQSEMHSQPQQGNDNRV